MKRETYLYSVGNIVNVRVPRSAGFEIKICFNNFLLTLLTEKQNGLAFFCHVIEALWRITAKK